MIFPQDPNNNTTPNQFSPNGAHAPVPRRPMPPQPPRFWQIVLKDMATTVVGVGFFCVLMFVLFVTTLGVVGKAISEIDPQSGEIFVEKTLRGDENCANKVVVLPIEGVIETEETGFIAESIKAIRKDPRVSALVLRVNSPGGTISGSDYYLNLLKKLKSELEIPIVVSMGDMATSGGYYISTVGDKIFAERSTTTGSIGVIVSMYNAAELCKKIGVRSSSIVSGPMKGMGDFMKEPTPEENAIWQKCVDDSYEQFLNVVKDGRAYYRGVENAPVAPKARRKTVAGITVKTVKENVAPEESDVVANEKNETNENTTEEPEQVDKNILANDESQQNEDTEEPEDNVNIESLIKTRDAELRKLADGRIYSAQDAKDLRLIDEIGFLDDAIDAAIDMADLVENKVHVVRYEEEEDFFQSLLSVVAKEQPLGDAMKAFAVPRGYYICPRALPIP